MHKGTVSLVDETFQNWKAALKEKNVFVLRFYGPVNPFT